MALVKHNNNSISAVTSMASLSTGVMVLISEQTASGVSSVEFTSGIDSTYPIYKFVYFDIHPSINDRKFQVNFRDGGSSFDATKTSTAFNYYHNESGSASSLGYSTGLDLAQSTSAQFLTGGMGNDNDQSCVGEILLFNPSSTTFVKHFLSTNNNYEHSDYSEGFKVAGYCNTTSAIDGVQFSMNEGNIDSGTIKMYGIKDS
jgi:hypothetical protein